MKVLAVIFAIWSLVNCNNEPVSNNGVYILTEKTFENFVSARPFVFVYFYTTSCKHCEAFSPRYDVIAKHINKLKFGDDKKQVAMAKVNIEVERNLAQHFMIERFPYFKWFADGRPYDFDRGIRGEQDFVDFIKERTDPSWKPDENRAVHLTYKNFHKFINKHELSLVSFCDSFNAECRMLQPMYQRAARRLTERRQGKTIHLGYIDSTPPENQKLMKKYGIKNIPGFKVFRKKVPFDFKLKGSSDEHSIVEYMENQATLLTRLEDKTSLDRVLREAANDVVVVGFFENDDDPFLKAFCYAADQLQNDGFKIFHVEKDLWQDYDITQSTVAVYLSRRLQTKYEPKRYLFTDNEAKPFEIADFIKKHSVPLVGNFAVQSRYAERYPLCLFFYTVDFTSDFRAETQKWRKKIAAIAKDYKDITFAVADDEAHAGVMQDFGLEESSGDMNVGCYDSKGNKHPLEPPMESWDADEVRSFLDKMTNGELTPYAQATKRQKEEL